MSGVLAFVLALVIYPGIAAGLAAAWVLSWTREATRSALSSHSVPRPFAVLRQLRAAFGRDTLIPNRVHSAIYAMVPAVALAAPVAALILLPLPGNPLSASLGMTGDLAAEGALVLVVPFARLLLGWATPSPYTRLAADRGAHLLAGCLVPMILAFATIGQQVGALQITSATASVASGLTYVGVAARALAAAAFACCLPVLARSVAGHDDRGDLVLGAGELTEVSGRDLATFRLAEGLQLVAVAILFATVFVVPALATAPTGLRAAAWIVAPLLAAAGVGAWEALRGAASPQSERPPLSWWFGVPLLLALFALVAASFAARGF